MKKILLLPILCCIASLGLNAQVQIWNSDFITFTKMDNADETLAANQDRITDSVWIARGDKKSIYNAAVETKDSTSSSPEGTLWAKGKTENINTLNFQNFRAANGSNPPGMVDEDYVLFLIKDSIYIDIKVTSWSGGNSGGGFAYSRATKFTSKNTSKETVNSSFISCFPSPFNQSLNVSHKEKISSIVIKDILGKTIYSEIYLEASSSEQQIVTHNFRTGVYFLFVNESKPIKIVKN